MNLSSMMYRLNVQNAGAQHPQQPQSQPQQQQQQQPHQQQAIVPSHVLLQQQLNASAASASAPAGSPAVINLHTSSTATTAGIHLAEGGHGATSSSGSSSSTSSGSGSNSISNAAQAQLQVQLVGARHGRLASETSSTLSTSSTSAMGATDKKLRAVTIVKSEPLRHEVVALTKAVATAKSNNVVVNNNNSHSNNNNNNNNNNNSNNNNNNSSSNSNSNSCSSSSLLSHAAGHVASVSTNNNTNNNSNHKSLSVSKVPLAGAILKTPTVASCATPNTINLVVGAPSTPSATTIVIATAPPAASSSASASAPAPAAASTAPAAVATSPATTAAATTNGHLVFVPSKRPRLDGPEEWISTPSPGSVPSSAPPLSPSPGSQNHNFSALSNISSPMSAGSYDPYSPNGKAGRDDLSPSSSLNGYSASEGCDAKKSKKGPAPRLQEELCLVCGDRASGYHYNALTCEGCKGFFRRSVTKNAVYCCKFGRACEMDMYMRRKCQECRLKKCLAVGMRPECVVPENQCAMKRREKKAQKEKDKQQASPSSTNDYMKKEILQLMKCEQPTHPTCPLLTDDIIATCQARNIPPLTSNQLAVIYKLIWYQDGYEQPSEEDLKRIMSTPDENESPHDINFRHITEITILTVQLIVEFAKGLPAFTQIPQEDQITLLKACSSEVMMLRMARRYDHNSDSIFFANNRSYTRDAYKMAGVADNIEDLLHFCRIMYSMKVDNVEYALLTAIVIFSDRPGLEEAELVEAIQSYYIDTLRIYILNRHCGDPMSLVFFAKLLSILTELRTLGNQNAEMCFSLKLKNRKLPKFLEEIWDVHAIPPPVQSHIQATQAEREAQEANAASTSAQAAAAAAAAAVAASSLSVASSSTSISSISSPAPVSVASATTSSSGAGSGSVASSVPVPSVSVSVSASATSSGGATIVPATSSSSPSSAMGSLYDTGSPTSLGMMGMPMGVGVGVGVNVGVGMGVVLKQEHMFGDENSTAA